MDISIRPETCGDQREVELLTREAFWGFLSPTCDEHHLAHLLRKDPAFIPELDFVAESDGRLVGNVMYSRARILSAEGERETAEGIISFGPLSVLPEYQRHGVGTALMRHTILLARQLGYRAIVFFGHPDYYPRFGFQPASVFGITAPDGGGFDALMAMELYDGALANAGGRFFEAEVYERCGEGLAEFDRELPAKPPAAMTPIDVLLERLPTAQAGSLADCGMTWLEELHRISGRELVRREHFDEAALGIVNSTLREYGIAGKLPPSSEILQRSKLGIKAIL